MSLQAAKRADPRIDEAHPSLESGPRWTREAQAKLSREVASDLGYCFNCGRLDESTHPFTGGAGPTDVRITTRFSENWRECFGATVHEAGHALYEQVTDKESKLS